MPDSRSHRGAHPEDATLFGPSALQSLRSATADLSWLLSRDYAMDSSLSLVGNRYKLTARQRLAVARAVAAQDKVALRTATQVSAGHLAGEPVWIDGYNVLLTVEAALGGAVIIAAQDGTYRDMASVHGSYRKVEETVPAIELIGRWLAGVSCEPCHWLLDSPVSNSGRLKTILYEVASVAGWNWQVELVPDPDKIQAGCEHIVATSDSQILNQSERWLNLARTVVSQIEGAWIVDLS